MTQFQAASISQPFTSIALEGLSKASPSLRVVTKNSEYRTKLALTLSEDVVRVSDDVKLCPDIEKLCDQLRQNLDSYSIPTRPRPMTVSLQDSQSVYNAHRFVANQARLCDALDSLFCLVVYWGTETGQKKYERVCNWFSSKVKDSEEQILQYCREQSLRGQKIWTFCTEFLKNKGTVFLLPSDVKS